MAHYKCYIEIVEKLTALPAGVRRAIINKPATTDRKADMAWRRLCAEHGIETGAVGILGARTDYDRLRYLEERVKELEARLVAAKARDPIEEHRRFHPRA